MPGQVQIFGFGPSGSVFLIDEQNNKTFTERSGIRFHVPLVGITQSTPSRLGTNSIFFHFISDFSAIFFLPSYGRWPGTGRKLSDYCPSARSQHVNFKLNLYFCISCHCSPLLLFLRFGSQICQEFAPSATTPKQVLPYSAHEIKKTRRGNQFSHLNFPLGVSLRLFKISRCPYVRVCCCSRLGTGWWFVSSDSVLSKGFGSHRL